MSVIMSARGTSVASFQFGKQGPTLYQGSADPSVTPPSSVNGDFYIRTGASAGIYQRVSGTWTAVSGAAGVTSITVSPGSTKISVSGSPITTSGTITLDVVPANIDINTLGGTPLTVVNGGTSFASYTTGDVLYASSSSALAKLGIGSTGQFLQVAAGLPGWATLSLTGDVTGTVSSASVTTTIAANAVTTTKILNAAITYAKIQNEAATTLLGNPTGSPAAPSEVTLGATLAFSGSAVQTGAGTGDITWSANSFATTLATVNSNVGTFTALTVNGKGLTTAATNLALTGDVTGTASGSGLATTIAANAVTTTKILNAAITYAKIQNEAATTLLGNPTGSPAAPSEVTLGTTLAFTGSAVGVNQANLTLSSIGGTLNLGSQVTSILGTVNGGTALGAYTANNILYASSSSVIGQIAPTGTNTYLKWTGSAYTWGSTSGSGIASVSADPAPALGGNLSTSTYLLQGTQLGGVDQTVRVGDANVEMLLSTFLNGNSSYASVGVTGSNSNSALKMFSTGTSQIALFSAQFGTAVNTAGSGQTPPSTGDANYVAGVGVGGAANGNGGAGLVVITSTSGTVTFTAIGANQTYTVPGGVTTISVKVWGAGGGGSTGLGLGGAGGYSSGSITVTPAEGLTVVVGAAGRPDPPGGTGYGGGGAAGSSWGGGRSAIRRSSTELITAGGGGGGGTSSGANGGAGGGALGVSGGGTSFGTGGSQVAGGTGFNVGTALQGGSAGGSGGGGGGGGGYFGGGASNPTGGGGGGSGYVGGTSGGGSLATLNDHGLNIFFDTAGQVLVSTSGESHTGADFNETNTDLAFSAKGTGKIQFYLDAAAGGTNLAHVSSNGVTVASGFLQHTVNAAVTATGTTQGGATALTKGVNIITTSTAGTGLGVVLPAAAVGRQVFVRNNTANNISVYPASGSSINAGTVNVAVTVNANTSSTFYATTTTAWFN